MAKPKNINIILPFFSNLWLKIVAALNRFLVFFQLREKRSFWGIVYDSVSKQALDPVKVSLVYADSGKVEGSCITDLEGRYGFLARPGRFKILVQRTNYEFPSKIVPGEKDGIYTHLYHGEFFEIYSESEVVAPNIPMDPKGSDWNQKSKAGFVHTYFYFRLFLEKFLAVVLWLGFFSVAGISILTGFKLRFAVYGLAVYFLIFVLELVMPKMRLWGHVAEAKSGLPVLGLRLKLFNPKLPNIVFGSAVTRDDGRFFLRSNPGKYLLEVSDDETGRELGSLPVRVPSEGVLNATIKIRLENMV